jgi:hypothetical protein
VIDGNALPRIANCWALGKLKAPRLKNTEKAFSLPKTL